MFDDDSGNVLAQAVLTGCAEDERDRKWALSCTSRFSFHGRDVNGNRDYFEAAIRDLALAQAQYPGWAERLLTHPVQGLETTDT